MIVTDTVFLASDSDSIQLEDIKNVWYFQPILERILFSFVTRLLATRLMFLSEFVVIRTTLKSGVCMILGHVVYDAVFLCHYLQSQYMYDA